MIAFSIGCVSLAIWLYLVFGRGLFWKARLPEAAAGNGTNHRVVAVIPARDEAAAIATVIGSLLGQSGDGLFKIVLVDDQSSDGTAAMAQDAALAAGAADRLIVVSGAPLPPGWTGKLWAMRQGIEAARGLDPDYLLLTDADIVHAPGHVAALASRAASGDYDLLSEMVELRCTSVAEQALIPAFVFFFFMLYPPFWVRDPKDRTAAAAGGVMLIRPRVLDRFGGIDAIRGSLIDDCALAAAVKRSGGRIRLDLTRDAQSLRIYGTFSEIWAMVARTAFTQLGYSPAVLAVTLLGLSITYLAPPLLVIFAANPARLLGVMAWLMMALAYRPTVRFYRLPSVWALALPAIALFYAAATLGSAIDYWRGRGGQWKGRMQARHDIVLENDGLTPPR